MSEPPPKKRLPIVLRPCFEMDLQFVQLIYAHHVLTGVSSFDVDPPDVETMRARWVEIAAEGWPYLVACAANDATRVLGFAYARPFRERAAYRQTFEDSLYVAPQAQGKGIGLALLASLIEELQALEAQQMVALIADPGAEASIGLHQRAGFAEVGRLKEAGLKFGRRLDVVLMQRSL